MIRIGLAALALSLAALPAAAQPDLQGAWTLPLSEQTSGGTSAWVRETITFGQTENEVRLEAFADEGAAAPLFTYTSCRPYEITGPSPSIPNAWHLDARNDEAEVTVFVDMPNLWELLNLGACAFEVGVPLEIGDCVSGPPFNTAGCIEADLVAVEGAALRLGDRASDRCEARPETLSDLMWMRE